MPPLTISSGVKLSNVGTVTPLPHDVTPFLSKCRYNVIGHISDVFAETFTANILS